MNEEIMLVDLEKMSRPELFRLAASDKRLQSVRLSNAMKREEMVKELAIALGLIGAPAAQPNPVPAPETASMNVKIKDAEPTWRVTINAHSPEDDFEQSVSVNEETVFLKPGVPTVIKDRFYRVLKDAVVETEKHEEVIVNGRPSVVVTPHRYHRFSMSAERVS